MFCGYYNYTTFFGDVLFLSDVYLRHLMTMIVSVFLYGYHGKTIDFAKASSSHRTTIAHFLNDGKWDSDKLQDILKESVIHVINHMNYAFF